MSEKLIKENKMGTMPVGRLLITMSLPMIASMLVQALYNVVDTMFVSYIPYEGLESSPAVAALAIAFIVQNKARPSARSPHPLGLRGSL